ncbi:hypothetical protein JD844_033620 [Phrynosoma platyrhinos]|uniref:GP-PDE domain-containing protein n=1 Tax=Phrynosoma platyrhinos TaxID=52577 RepID=A0ABQ7T708_PHRPL|nr:hypothetical protein JD844_033620 [Phrynosoma platyrhinos]
MQLFCLSQQITAPFLHLGAILVMTILAWPVALHFFRMRNKVMQVLILTPYLCVLLFLLFIPLGMHSPCIRNNGTLGPKPDLIGHRGAPMKKPFFGMPTLSKNDQKWAMDQKIFKFIDFLKLAEEKKKYVIFDVYRPPKYHPYRNTYIQRLLEVLQNESGITPNLVLWLHNPGRHYVLDKAPGFQQTAGNEESIGDLQSKNIVKLNLDYRKLASIDIR